jgi:large subunit ribosomal protein L10
MMTREHKASEITRLSERFAKAKAAFIVDYKGISVEKMTGIRKSLRQQSAEMKVVRNTLAIRALADHPSFKTPLEEQLFGTNAIVFAYDDVSATAKSLSSFVKDIEELQIKSGAMDGRALAEAQIQYLATLPPKPELQAKLLGLFQAPAAKFVRTLNEVPSKFVRVLAARRDQVSNAG